MSIIVSGKSIVKSLSTGIPLPLDGLSVYYDFSNPQSYEGSPSTTLLNLVNNSIATGSLQGSPTFNPDESPAYNFLRLNPNQDFISSDRIITAPFPDIINDQQYFDANGVSQIILGGGGIDPLTGVAVGENQAGAFASTNAPRVIRPGTISMWFRLPQGIYNPSFGQPVQTITLCSIPTFYNAPQGINSDEPDVGLTFLDIEIDTIFGIIDQFRIVTYNVQFNGNLTNSHTLSAYTNEDGSLLFGSSFGTGWHNLVIAYDLAFVGTSILVEYKAYLDGIRAPLDLSSENEFDEVGNIASSLIGGTTSTSPPYDVPNPSINYVPPMESNTLIGASYGTPLTNLNRPETGNDYLTAPNITGANNSLDVGAFLFYNKRLSDSEIIQQYNALSPRYFN